MHPCMCMEREGKGGFRISAKHVSSVHYSCISPIYSVCGMFKGLSVQYVLQNENGEKRDEK